MIRYGGVNPIKRIDDASPNAGGSHPARTVLPARGGLAVSKRRRRGGREAGMRSRYASPPAAAAAPTLASSREEKHGITRSTKSSRERLVRAGSSP